ncbi:hypothetical protein LTR97_011329 [Elasticomyces elasticus]|uniref:Heterokaryon incompatibility domain-containing protein n=1 Tax=Elasticomyces elasticus TaxID=574655 RepID=A0AAN7W1P8_9PEZI|nr:hypothetical protein LTR97_011329 [Elasticomyces elasticus]
MSGIPYQPLDASRKEIRVLDLLPGRYKSPIKCRLRTVSIADKENLPFYAALSYTWGSAENRRSITVSVDEMDYVVSTTRNLFVALRGLRSRWRKEETLWIDALGIDQSDDEEKASQVAFMGEVYKSAAKTYVWLGSSVAPESPLHEMHSLHRMMLRFVQAVPEIWKDVYGIMGSWAPYVGFEDGLRSLHLAITAGLHTLDQALSHTTPSWQHRAWVLQEYVLSSAVYFCWDGKRIKEPINGSSYSAANVMWHWRDSFDFLGFIKSLGKLTGPQHTLAAHKLALYSQAGNPHDKVFSLLGFIEEASACHILIDYTAPFWVTCARATYASTTERFEHEVDWNRLKVLEIVTRQIDRPPSFPSWAADFSRIPPCLYGFSHMASFQWPGLDDHFDAGLSTDLRRLTTQGVRFGRVVNVLRLYKLAKNSSSERRHARFVTEDAPPSEQVGSLRELLATALRAHESTRTCFHPYPDVVSKSTRLAKLENYLNHADASDVDIREIEKVLRACFFCWKSQLNLQQSANYPCCYKSWCPKEYNGSMVPLLEHATSSVQLFASDDGYLGFAPHDIEVGDTIVFLRGATWPAVLWQSEDRWFFRSLVYLSGVMDGELQGAEDEPSWETEPFVLH